ncbi:MAG: hypothetical protein ACK4PR_06020 [Gammaproteobacteria bacterium]
MTILRIQKHESHFVVLDKGFLNDSKLSMQAKGLLSYLLGLPHNWNINIIELTKHFSNGKHAITATIDELIKFGYILRQRQRGSGGKFTAVEYFVYENPINDKTEETQQNEVSKPLTENQIVDNAQPLSENQKVVEPPQSGFPGVDNPAPEKPQSGNQTLINNIYNKQPKLNNAAAALDDFDLIIGESLTVKQLQHVKKMASRLTEKLSLPVDKITKDIITTLLSKKSFTRTGQEFLYKLRVITKAMSDGTWTPPIDILLKEKEKQEKVVQQWQDKRNELIKKINFEKIALTDFQGWHKQAVIEKRSVTSILQTIANQEKKIESLLDELKTHDGLRNNKNDLSSFTQVDLKNNSMGLGYE